jgi:3-keto-5-aminohexanoate cleavage enzyme
VADHRVTKQFLAERPVVIEAAISPLRRDLPAQTTAEIILEANTCLAAGAGIVHHHHDNRLDVAASTQQLIDVSEAVLARYPSALIYTDYLPGRTAIDEYANLQPMVEAGVLRMFAVDPGITTFGSFDAQGLPTRTYTDGLKFSEVHELCTFAQKQDVPLSLGVFEPGQLRWILAYEAKVGFPKGTLIKLYFGGRWMVDQVNTPGINFGLPPTTAALNVYLSMMEGSNLAWITSVFGDAMLDSPIARYTLERGGHLRVGIEDAAGQTSLTNAEMVTAAIALATEVGRPVANQTATLSALGPSHAG